MPNIATNASMLFVILSVSYSAIFSNAPIRILRETAIPMMVAADPILIPLTEFAIKLKPAIIPRIKTIVDSMFVASMSLRSSNALTKIFKDAAKDSITIDPVESCGAAFPRRAETVAKPAANTPRIAMFRARVSPLSPSIFLRATTRIKTEDAKATKDVDPLMEPLTLFSLPIKVVKASKAAERATIAPTADHILAGSSNVRTAIEAARTAIASAILRIASAFSLNA